MFKYLLVLFALTALAHSVTICEKYFGTNDTFQYEQMHNQIGNIVGLLLGDSFTAGYFNGDNGGSVNFTDPANSALLDTLVDHLTTFFGSAIGCSGAAADYSGNPNMLAVHSFQVPVNKAAFEHFNWLVCQNFRTAGVVQEDIYVIGQVLDGFRTGDGTANNQICQDDDCVTSPYTIFLGGSVPNSIYAFNPPYISIPNGFTLNFNNLGGVHNVVDAGDVPEDTTGGDTATGLCSAGTTAGGWTSPGAPGGFTGNFSHVVTESEDSYIGFFCSIHCPGSSDGFWGVYEVLASVNTNPTTGNPATTRGSTTNGVSGLTASLVAVFALVLLALL